VRRLLPSAASCADLFDSVFSLIGVMNLITDGIYIHRHVEFHSTTELRSKLSKDARKDPFAERETWVDIEGAETNETYKGDTSCSHAPIDKD
jgi:hypothetical protein